MFEKVSRSLKYDSNFFIDHKHIYIYQDTKTNHFTPLALRVWGNNQTCIYVCEYYSSLLLKLQLLISHLNNLPSRHLLLCD